MMRRNSIKKSNTIGSVSKTDSKEDSNKAVHRSQSEIKYPDSADRTLSDTSSSRSSTPREMEASSSMSVTPRETQKFFSKNKTPRETQASSSSHSSPSTAQHSQYSFHSKRVKTEQTYLYFRVESSKLNYQQYSLTEEQLQKYIDDFFPEIEKLLKEKAYQKINERVALIVSSNTLLFKRVEACVKSKDKNNDEKLERIKELLSKEVLTKENVSKCLQNKLCEEVQSLFLTRKSLKSNCLTVIDSNDKSRGHLIKEALKYNLMLVEINATKSIWKRTSRNLQWKECAIQNLIENKNFKATLYVPVTNSHIEIKINIDLSAPMQTDVPAPSPQKKKGIFGRG